MANERTSMYLQPEVKQALTEYVERTKAESISAAANDLIQRGLVALSAKDTGDVAAPAIAEAISRRVEDLLRTVVVGPLRAELAAIPTRRRWRGWKDSPTSPTTTGHRWPNAWKRRSRNAPKRRARRARCPTCTWPCSTRRGRWPDGPYASG